MDERDRRRRDIENSRRMFHISRSLTRQLRRPMRSEAVERIAGEGVKGMDLIGVVNLFLELAADATDQENLRQMIRRNAEQSGLSDDLTAVLLNSVGLVERDLGRGRPGGVP